MFPAAASRRSSNSAWVCLKPDAGEIFVDAEEIVEVDETELQRLRDKIGMVFQEGALFDSLPVYENVAFRLQEHGVPEEAIEEEVCSLLKFVKLEKEMDKLPGELLRGRRKRRALRRLKRNGLDLPNEFVFSKA